MIRWFRRLSLVLGFSVGTAVAIGDAGAAVRWQYIRDGVLHLAPTGPDQLQVDWRPAWNSGANADALFLQDGKGELLEERTIAPSETSGSHRWPLQPNAGPYRLEIAGYSFREFRVIYGDATSGVFEPAKVHFSAEVPDGTVLYFSVPRGAAAVLNGKNHEGVRQLEAVRLSDGHRVVLALAPHREYPKFDSARLPVSQSEEVWQLTLIGGGKAAFWLDGTDNLFAQDRRAFFRPAKYSGMARITVDPANQRGRPPALGLALPYAELPPIAVQALRDLAPGTASYYSFLDVLASNPAREAAIRRSYRDGLNIMRDYTILARSGRQSVLRPDRGTLGAIDTWVESMAGLAGNTEHFLALADEPNLNYPDYDSFSRYYVSAAERVRAHPRAVEARIRLVAPVSSRFADGPTREGAAARKGIDWTRRLLTERRDLVDAVGWHWWQVRDLRATRSIRRDIRAAAELVGLDAAGQPRIPLVISQTNLSSGSGVSPYDQDTSFAALWWASVAVNSAIDGWLSALVWFKAADDPIYPKGLFRLRGDGMLERKPVGDAMAFVSRFWGGQVLATTNTAFEVDAVALTDGTRLTVVGVNKGERAQDVTTELAGSAGFSGARIEMLSFDEASVGRRSACLAGKMPFRVPARALFAIVRDAKGGGGGDGLPRCE